MLVICPTADCEIYFGKNSLPAEEVLFEPTKKVLSLLSEFEVKATLFPDICSIWRHKELGIQGYADTFESLIIEAAKEGHDIQLHLHPEWRFAEFKGGAWNFKSGTHALHDFGFSEEDSKSGRQLIAGGKRYLEELLQPENPKYRCRIHRAGGWIIRPEADLFSALLSEGLDVDATIIPGIRILRADYEIDFRNVPNTPNWYMNPSTGIMRDSGNKTDLLEISIASYRGCFPIWQHVINEMRLRKRAGKSPEPIRGHPITKSGPRQSPIKKLSNKYKKITIPRILDMADTHESMLRTLKSYLRKYDCRRKDYAICMNGHPKDTYDYHLKELRKFFSVATHRYAGSVKFQTISEFVAKTLEKPFDEVHS